MTVESEALRLAEEIACEHCHMFQDAAEMEAHTSSMAGRIAVVIRLQRAVVLAEMADELQGLTPAPRIPLMELVIERLRLKAADEMRRCALPNETRKT